MEAERAEVDRETILALPKELTAMLERIPADCLMNVDEAECSEERDALKEMKRGSGRQKKDDKRVRIRIEFPPREMPAARTRGQGLVRDRDRGRGRGRDRDRGRGRGTDTAGREARSINDRESPTANQI
jgi:hypothetical protein